MVPPTSHKVSRVSWYFGYCLSLFVFPYGAFTLSGRLSQYRSGNSEYNLSQSLTLQCTHRSLGSFPFARRYSGNRCFFLFLRVLRCFSSPGSLPYVMDWRMDTWGLLMRVSPFRHLRIKDYLHLPAAFRSLSRLSSALSAKASTLRSFLLDYSILVIIALITFVTNFWSVTYYSLKNFTVITMSWSNRYLIILSFCMRFSKYNVLTEVFISHQKS